MIEKKNCRNILLVDPMGDKEANGFNLGLAYLSAVLRKAGRTVSVLDLVNIRAGDDRERLKKAVGVFSPDAVGLSIQNLSYRNAKSLISYLRTVYPGPILVGGSEVTARKQTVLDEIPEADVAFVGEAEESLPECLDCVEKGGGLSGVAGIVWRDGTKVVHNSPRPPKADLDAVPSPDWEVFGLKSIDRYLIMSSRGCPFNCSFCFSYLGRTWRKRDPRNVIDEIKTAIGRYGAKLIQFADPAFNIDPKRVVAICDLMMKEKIDIPWMAYGVRADTLTRESAAKMREAGCRRLYIGIESLDPDVLREVGKGETIEDIKRGLAIAKECGLEVYGYLIIGLPKDTFERTMRSFEEAEKLGLDSLAWASAVPYTGTRLQEWVKANARQCLDSTEVSSLGTNLDTIAYETDDFPYHQRVLARKLMYLKSGYYSDPAAGKLRYWLNKLAMMWRYDRRSIHRRVLRALRYRFGVIRGDVNTILRQSSARLARVPDGTWGLGKDDSLPESHESVLIDFTRM